MKKLNYFLFTGMMIMFVISCGKDHSAQEEDCKATVQPEIERSFHLGIEVLHKDSVPYYATVYMTVRKVYCSGVVSGKYDLFGNPDNTGYWYPGKAPTYIFANVWDHVEVFIRIPNPDGDDYKLEDAFYYVDVEQQYFGIEKTYKILLPWYSK